MGDPQVERGVRIFEDHRDNLTIDVESELLHGRAAQLRSEHSEAALLWNVFRTLEKLDVRSWLPRLLRHALPEAARGGWLPALLTPSNLAAASFQWWQRWDLPESRHAWLHEAALAGGLRLDHWTGPLLADKRVEAERRLAAALPFEDPVELPLVIETDTWRLGVEAVYKGNLRRHIPFDAHRDAVLRLLDAGSHGAASRGKRFLLLILCTEPRSQNLDTARLVERYRNRPERLLEALPHRRDIAVVEAAAAGLGVARWKDLGTLLIETKAAERLGRFDVTALDELIKYLGRKELGFNFFRRLK
jgi:hypothetical protein